jgi:hypothetical protein
MEASTTFDNISIIPATFLCFIACARAYSLFDKMKRSKRTILAGAGVGAAVGAVTMLLFSFFCIFGVDIGIAATEQGWQVLLLPLGWGVLLGSIIGSITAPAEYTLGRAFGFVTRIIVYVPAFFCLVIVIALRLARKLGK